ncbi:hypothetical protein GCM10020254_28840 [Streptomyces goshikiensis]
MATPHVAGAAALLKQQHPAWKGAELKGALTASAKGAAYNPFQQGAGRIAVDAALRQSVVAQEAALSFGTQRWPHADDTPQSRKITYRNLGGTPVTLDLAVTGSGPDGKPAPGGFFTLGARRLTVPAGGTAETTLSADTRLGGTLDGTYSAYAVATAAGGEQSVRTGAVVEREPESYDVTLRHLGRDGKPTKNYGTTLQGVKGGASALRFEAYDASGTVKLRVPKGGYLLDASLAVDPLDLTKGADWIVQPRLDITGDTTVTLDARTTRPVDITVPATSAVAQFAMPSYTLREGDAEYGFGFWLDSLTGFRTRQLGPAPAAGTLSQQWDVHWRDGASAEYHAVLGGPVRALATGYTRHLKARDLAVLTVAQGGSAPGKEGALTALGNLPGSSSATSLSIRRPLPTTATVYVSTLDQVKWDLSFTQSGGQDENGFPIEDAWYAAESGRTLTGGRTYHERLGTAVLAPRVYTGHGVSRKGNEITGSVPLLADGAGHPGRLVRGHRQHGPLPRRRRRGPQPGPAGVERALHGPGGRRGVQADHDHAAAARALRDLVQGDGDLVVPLEGDGRAHRAPRLLRPLRRPPRAGRHPARRPHGDVPGHRRGPGGRGPGHRPGLLRRGLHLAAAPREGRQGQREDPGEGRLGLPARHRHRRLGQQGGGDRHPRLPRGLIRTPAGDPAGDPAGSPGGDRPRGRPRPRRPGRGRGNGPRPRA